jgi:hypothetical protein
MYQSADRWHPVTTDIHIAVIRYGTGCGQSFIYRGERKPGEIQKKMAVIQNFIKFASFINLEKIDLRVPPVRAEQNVKSSPKSTAKRQDGAALEPVGRTPTTSPTPTPGRCAFDSAEQGAAEYVQETQYRYRYL